MKSLSPQAVLKLPDSTTVLIGSRAVTMRVLRQEHQMRMQRFAQASALGARIRISAGSLQRPPAGVRAATGQVNPTIFNTEHAVPPLKNLDQGAFTVPADSVAFCAGAGATGCFYLPGGVTLYVDAGNAFDFDPLIQDAGICSNEGGMLTGGFGSFTLGSGCYYVYPHDFLGNFQPGASAKGPTTFKSSCAPMMQVQTSSHGAIKITPQLPASAFNPGAAPVTCVVTAFTPS
ncbi:MAG: hypothetical protein JOZ24_00525 [Candidatus Eremiobacteraeota bacterium]|nr:hypothetical protein [Candidatus Eremiobacteraeota bacterium]